MNRNIANIQIQLRYWRKRRGISVSALAKEAEISTRTIYQIEHQGKNTISMERAERIAKALRISVDDLIVDISEPAA